MVIEGAVEHVPAELLEQLSAVGILLAFRNSASIKEAVCFKKENNTWVEESLFEADVPLLSAFCRDKSFDF